MSFPTAAEPCVSREKEKSLDLLSFPSAWETAAVSQKQDYQGSQRKVEQADHGEKEVIPPQCELLAVFLGDCYRSFTLSSASRFPPLCSHLSGGMRPYRVWWGEMLEKKDPLLPSMEWGLKLTAYLFSSLQWQLFQGDNYLLPTITAMSWPQSLFWNNVEGSTLV